MAAPYVIFPGILVPILIISSKCQHHNTNNDTDVIVRYSGHAEAVETRPEPETTTLENIKILIPESIIQKTTEPNYMDKIPESFVPTTTEPEYMEATEDVVFVPNEKTVERNDDRGDGLKIDDILYKKTVGDIISGQNVRIETEAPTQDIVFVSGKNNDHIDTPKNRHVEKTREEIAPFKDTRKTKIILNCTNLDCDNTLKSICGVKKDGGQLKYRLFLNDCYFRKVNCNFKYEENRYKQVDREKCKNIGSHNAEKTFSFKPMSSYIPKPETINNFRRSSSSRRSLSMSLDGKFCSHTCPTSCPDDYDPECAVSNSGVRRVFVNHCKMDFDSCFYNMVWHMRPLSECVGGKKADMRQNRGFISWMQKVGIVDNKGRLVLS